MSNQPTESSHISVNAETALRTLYQQLLAYWNARDSAGFASLFVADGDSIGFDGSQLIGQAAIAASLRDIFAHHATPPYVSKIRAVRQLSADVGVVRAVAGMAPAGQTQLDPAFHSVQTLVAIQRDGQWLITLFQNTPAQFHGRPDEAQQLTEELQQLVP